MCQNRMLQYQRDQNVCIKQCLGVGLADVSVCVIILFTSHFDGDGSGKSG